MDALQQMGSAGHAGGSSTFTQQNDLHIGARLHPQCWQHKLEPSLHLLMWGYIRSSKKLWDQFKVINVRVQKPPCNCNYEIFWYLILKRNWFLLGSLQNPTTDALSTFIPACFLLRRSQSFNSCKYDQTSSNKSGHTFLINPVPSWTMTGAFPHTPFHTCKHFWGLFRFRRKCK